MAFFFVLTSKIKTEEKPQFPAGNCAFQFYKSKGTDIVAKPIN